MEAGEAEEIIEVVEAGRPEPTEVAVRTVVAAVRTVAAAAKTRTSLGVKSTTRSQTV